ncbi:MAG: hypothetical protein ABJE47_21090 [bacterium]
MPDTAIVAVFDEHVCAPLRDAYNSALPSAKQASGRSVYVIRVGTVYVVDDPTLKFGEFGLKMTIDQSHIVLTQSTQ